MVSKLLQDGPKMARRWLNKGQVPGWVHGGSRNAHMSPKEAQNDSKEAQDRSKEAQDGSKMSPRGPKMAPGGLKRSANWPKMEPEGDKNTPLTASWSHLAPILGLFAPAEPPLDTS